MSTWTGLRSLPGHIAAFPRIWRLSTSLALCLLVAMLWTEVSYRTGNRLYDQFIQWIGFSPSPDVVVLAIDARTRERLGPWPLSRSYYAHLLERLATSPSPPRAVGLDLLFLDSRAEDELLAQQMTRGLPVVLPRILKTPDTGLVSNEIFNSTTTWRLPVAPLDSAAAGLGHIHVRFDGDGVIRGVQPLLQGQAHFSLAMLQAGGQLFTGVKPDEDYLRFRMVDPRIGFSSISLADALDPAIPLPDFGGKWLLVGVTDPALGDQHATIYSGKAAAGTPGVFLIASMLSAGLQQQWIRTVPAWIVFPASAVWVFFLQVALYRLPPGRAIGWAVGSSVALLGFSYALLTWFHWWFNVAPVLITLVLLWLFWAWHSLDGALSFMRRKSLELRESAAQPSALQEAAGTGSVVERYTGRLSRAIDLQAEQLQLLDQVLRHIPEGVAVLDVHDKVLLVNQSMAALLGQDPPTTWQLSDLLAQLALPFKDWSQLQQARANETSAAVFELTCPEGRRHVYLHAAVVDKPGVTPLHLLTVTDVTELQRSQAQRDQALSFLSHDMRTPVASILAVTQQLTQVLQGQPVQMVHRVTGHAEQLMRLMDGFLVESKAHSQDIEFLERLIDDLMEDAVAQAQDLARLRSMPLVVVPSDTFFFVQVASQLMVRSLLNVLMNAIKYGEPGTPIQLLTRQGGTAEQPTVVIEVSNQVALNPDSVDKDMLTQGFGLGLGLVKTVLRRHQGTTQLDIPPQGQARVLLTLPCVLDDGS